MKITQFLVILFLLATTNELNHKVDAITDAQQQPEKKTVLKGNNVLINCKSSSFLFSDPNVRYEWYINDNIKISSTQKYNLINDGLLEIKDFQDGDSANFKCFLIKSNHKILIKELIISTISTEPQPALENSSSNTKIPTVELVPSEYTAKRNESVLFECLTNYQADTQVTFKWFKDNKPLDLTKYDSKRAYLIQNANLIIEWVRESDSGEYRCEVCFKTSRKCRDKSSLLTVLTEPYFTVFPKSQNAALKSDVLFECSVKSEPKATVLWFKNGEQIYPSAYFQFVNETNLRILGVIKQDEGYYQCVASNKLSTVQAGAKLIITDENPSEIVFETKSKISEPVNFKISRVDFNSVALTWAEARVEPKTALAPPIVYTLSWFESSGTEARTRERELNTTKLSARIDDLRPDTRYTMQLRASCAQIRSKTAAVLTVKTLSREKTRNSNVLSLESSSQLESMQAQTSKLSRKNLFKGPMEFSYEKLSSQSIKLKWRMGNEFAQKKYRLYYTHRLLSEESPIDTEEKYLDISLSESNVNSDFILEDLKKFSRYEFRIVAVNSLNEFSESSAKIEVKTASDVPDAAPAISSLVVLNTTSIKVSCKPPAVDKRNGVISGYRITIKENEAKSNLTHINVEECDETIVGLKPGKKYLVRVTARTANGTGPASDWLIAQTFQHEMDESRVPGQPAELFVDPTDTSIFIHWLPPVDSNRTLIRKYMLKYGVFIPDNEIEIDGTKDSYIISDLTPSSQYILSLKAGNNVGYGQEMLKEVLTKRKSVLSDAEYLFPPLNLQAKTISQHLIELSWTDWHLKADEEIPDDRLYLIRYNEAESQKYKFVNASERNVQIDELKANTLYDFSVKLVVGRRESDWSMTTSQMTMEMIKAFAPRDINFKSEVVKTADKQHVNLIVSWRIPFSESIDQIQPGEVYVISYADEKSFKENRWKQESIGKSAAIDNAASMAESEAPSDDETHSEQPSAMIKMQAQIRRLKLETIYYFKIEEKNNREYLSQSQIVLFKTPDSNGLGSRLISSISGESDAAKAMDLSQKKISIEISMLWVIIAVCVSLVVVIVTLIGVYVACKKGTEKTPKKDSTQLQYQLNYDTNLGANIDNNNLMENEQSIKLLNINTNNSSGGSSSSCNTNSNNPWSLSSQTNNTSSINLSQSIASTSANGMVACTSNLSSLNEVQPLFTAASSTTSTIKRHQQQQRSLFANSMKLTSDEYNLMSEYQMHNNHELASLNEINESLLRASMPYTLDSNSSNQDYNVPNSSFLRASMRNAKPTAFDTQRKGFKQLPMATATLIPSGANSNGFFQQQNVQHKLQYTARPYMVDGNELEPHHNMAGEYGNSNSPCSSSNCSQAPVYDKIGNALNEMAAKSGFQSRSLLQPLKSFASASSAAYSSNMSPSAALPSIPSTPRHILSQQADIVSNNNLLNLKSPTKMFGGRNPMPLIPCQNFNSDSFSTNNANFNDNMYLDRKFSNNEELTCEMANLEGIMKDLSAITQHQPQPQHNYDS